MEDFYAGWKPSSRRIVQICLRESALRGDEKRLGDEQIAGSERTCRRRDLQDIVEFEAGRLLL